MPVHEKKLNIFRFLSVDDLIILSFLADGARVVEIAQHLSLSQSAVSQRIQKISTIGKVPTFERSGRKLKLSKEGADLALRAKSALKLLAGSVQTDVTEMHVVSVGTRPEVGMSWLRPAVFSLRVQQPQLCIHLKLASGEEILRDLQNQNIDAVLTSAPLLNRDFKSIEVAREEYVFVCKKGVSSKIQRTNDLSKHVLIEHDRGFPFLRYCEPETRAQLQFLDVWFLGSTQLMIDAIGAGFGVGIVPRYLAEPAIQSGDVEEILPTVKLGFDHFRLVYRPLAQLDGAMALLATELNNRGLSR